MSTQPSEAQHHIACLINQAKNPVQFRAGLQLLADSEARAVEAALKEPRIGGAHLCNEGHGWVTNGQPCYLCEHKKTASIVKERGEAVTALTAERERVRVLREAVEFWQSLRDESKGLAGFHLNGDIAEWSHFTTDPTDAALATPKEKTP